jgi:hypothetical protein
MSETRPRPAGLPEGVESFASAEDALHAAASAAAGGLDDFGDPSYLEGLRVLLQAYDEEAKFSDTGRQMAWQGLIQPLRARLCARELIRQNPSVLETEIHRPLVVTGLVRTGSTALHHLLGQDPDIQVLEYRLSANPQPRPPREEWEAHPGYRACVAELDAMYAADPSLKAIHFMEAGGPEECRHFLSQGFTDDGFEVNASVPSYTRWYEAKHIRSTYLWHRDLLKLVGSTSPEKRWILKYPVHMKNLGALLEVYPDACIVQTHRDPTKVMSSYVSLIAGFRALFEDDIDREDIAREQLEVWASGAERAIQVRRGKDESNFFDLHFQEFMADPIACVKRFYDRFDLELSEEGEKRLRAWQQGNPQGKHGKHAHSFEEAGISRGEVLERFGAYMDYFDLKPE